MLATLFLIICSISCAIFEKSFAHNDRPAIVFADVSSLLAIPNAAGKVIMKLHEGTKVYILSVEKTFSKVQLTDGVVGYIDSKLIKEVK